MQPIEKYFEGEKLQCIIGIVLSVINFSLALYFFYLQKPMLKGITYPFAILSVLLIVICIGVVIRSPKDIKRVNDFYTNTPQKIQTEELPRMQKVMKSFAIIKKVELVFMVIGVLLLIIFWKNEWLRGIGIGLLIQGVMLYTFDHLAEARGNVYIEFLKKIN